MNLENNVQIYHDAYVLAQIDTYSTFSSAIPGNYNLLSLGAERYVDLPPGVWLAHSAGTSPLFNFGMLRSRQLIV